MRLVYFGSGEFGLPTLQALVQRHEVALVVTQPDRPAGRKRQITPTPIAQWAESHGLRIIKPPKVNRPAVLDTVRAAGAEANVVAAFGQKIGDALIASPKLGPVATVNLHASLLPKYRGAAPINWTILRGEIETGNTIFSLVEKMDAGDMLARQTTPIDPLETAGELHDRLAAMGPSLMLAVLAQFVAGTARGEPQNEAEMSLAPKLSKADGAVDFRAGAVHVRRVVHGLTPWPGVLCWWGEQRQPLLLRRVQPVPDLSHDYPPGTLIDDGVLAVGHGEGVRLLQVQPPGKRTMAWEQFAQGRRIAPGTRFYGEPT